MAKTARLKNSNKAPSTHSRASRRASSPSLNIDKSLTSLKAPPRSSAKNVLAPSRGAGIAKSNPKLKAKGKVLKRKQKIRVERGKDRAEAVVDKMERKRGSVSRKEGRNADWDELNGKIGGRKGKRRKGKEEKGGDGEEGWEDEHMDVDVDGGKGLLGREGLGNEELVKNGVDGVDMKRAVEEEIL